MRDKILTFIRQNGPSLPVEVASKVGGDSFLAKAYLDELVEKGLLKRSLEKIGESFIYHAPGQEASVKEKVSKFGGAKTARVYAPKKVEVTPEIAKKREAFSSRLKEIETKKKYIPKKPLLEVAKETVKKVFNPEPRKNLVETAISFLISKNIEILQKEEKAKRADLIVNVPTSVGMVKFFVRIKDKKKISKGELVAIYAKALEQRMPAILLTNGELAETSKKYLKTVGGFLRVKVF